MTIVVCGAPLAALAQRLDGELRRLGWRTEWIATPSGLRWLEHQQLAQVVHSTYLPLDGRRTAVDREVVLIFPATFNTVNKVACGIADTYAHSVLCESLGKRLPFVVVAMVNAELRGHPIWTESVGRLMSAGAVFVDPLTGRICAAPDDLPDVAGSLSEVDEGRLMAAITAAVGPGT